MYDQDVEIIPAAPLSAWKVRIDGLARNAVSLTQVAPSVIDVNLAAFGFGTLLRNLDYAPPADSIRSTAGVPAPEQLALPIPP